MMTNQMPSAQLYKHLHLLVLISYLYFSQFLNYKEHLKCQPIIWPTLSFTIFFWVSKNNQVGRQTQAILVLN